MRENLFRGKRIDNGEWVYGYYVKLYDPRHNREHHCVYTGYAESDCDELFPDWYEVAPSTVGQYTGLTANGKKIFEGDILEGIRYGNEARAEVLWIDKAASWGILYSFRKKNESGYTAWLNSAWFRTINDARAPVVVGNIHDNSELLEVTE